MSFGQITIQVDRSLFNLEGLYADAVASVLEQECDRLISDLVNDSPEDEGDLKRGWERTGVSRRGGEFSISVVNEVPEAYERVVGRGPGTPPPASKLRPWASKRGINPYALARKIGRVGTDRWQSGQNAIGVNPQTGLYSDNAPPFQTADRISARLRRITISRGKVKGI